jgi:D-alanyl-lipoteichoic acid acyltransferase DltB (MBOAT superfamily)
MFLGGLWHGANWTFVVWGLLHGFYLVLQRALGGYVQEEFARSRWIIAARILGVFFFVCVAWVFFRAQTLSGAFDYLNRTFSSVNFFMRPHEPQVSMSRIYGVLIFVVAIDFLSARMTLRKRYLRSPYWRAAGAMLIIWSIIFFGRFDGAAFLYFQF